WGAPWANLRLGLQYTMFDKFNGARRNYDGSGRDAKDNNTLFLFAWTSF
ncbi:MAG: cytochrome C, partial [Proteobacteria bacterium]|nr:cytochrome C [Pseudomonadota bacterium]